MTEAVIFVFVMIRLQPLLWLTAPYHMILVHVELGCQNTITTRTVEPVKRSSMEVAKEIPIILQHKMSVKINARVMTTKENQVKCRFLIL